MGGSCDEESANLGLGVVFFIAFLPTNQILLKPVMVVIFLSKADFGQEPSQIGCSYAGRTK